MKAFLDLAGAKELQKLIRSVARRLIIHPSLDPALCIAIPKGLGLGEARQLVGSNEDAS